MELGPSQVGYPKGQDVAFSASWERTPTAWGGSPMNGAVGGKCPLSWLAGWQHLSHWKITLFIALGFVITSFLNLCCLLCTQEDDKPGIGLPHPTDCDSAAG